jgi:hypothetical protein
MLDVELDQKVDIVKLVALQNFLNVIDLPAADTV